MKFGIEIILGAVFTGMLVCIAVSEYQKYSAFNCLLDGYWESSLGFCQRSGIQSAHLYIKDGQAYFLIDKGDAVILNKCVTFDTSCSVFKNLCETDDVEYEYMADQDIDPIPQSGTLKINMRNGLMGLFKNDTLYMELYKNNKASSGVM